MARPRDPPGVAAGLCGILSATAFLAGDLLGAAATPGYSPTGQAISELVAIGAPAKPLVDPFLLAFHALAIPFALGLHRAVAPGPGGPLAPALLAAAGLAGMILTLFLPCDPGCARFVSLRGTLHIFVAIPMGLSVLLAILAFARRFRADPDWRARRAHALASAWAGLALSAITVPLAETDWVGLFERALTLSYLQWYALTGLALIRRSL